MSGWKRLRFHLAKLFALQLVVAVLISVAAHWPKSVVLPCCDDHIGWYRGFAGQPGLLRRKFFMVELHPTGRLDGTTRVYLTDREGYSPFRGHYLTAP